MESFKTSLKPIFYLLWAIGMVAASVMTIAAFKIANTPKPTGMSSVYFFQELSEKLFLNEAKVKAVLNEGHTIILIKSFDVDQKRPRLFVAKQTPTEIVEIDSSWFQPSLVYLMTTERILINRVNKNQLQVQGISHDTLAWMARN